MMYHLQHTTAVVRYGLALILALAAFNVGVAQTSYTVKSGDTLDGIGKHYGVAPKEISTLNNLENPNLIAPGMVLKIPPSPDAPVSYVVKAGDTLGSIAAANDSTVRAISEHNNITDPKTLRIGQTLEIPRHRGDTPASTERYPLPSSTKRLLDAMPANKTKWKHIVIHHSASESGSLQGMDMYHKQKRKMENGLAYHFVIGNGKGMPDGKIEIGNRWKRQIRGGHLASEAQNDISIGICLVGNFEKKPPSAAQMNSLYALISYLRNRCNIPKSGISTHKEINTKPTACPGRFFPTATLMKNL